jgi:Zn-dependent peptidase ImmA (M78 family)
MQVLARHWDGGLPVQPKVIAKVLGVHVLVEELGPEVAGIAETVQGRPRIHVNRFDHKLRQRFTIAHELGHFVDSRDRDFEFVEYRALRARQGVDQHEVFANSFAAELLMPATAIRKLLEESDIEERQMAREFEVSRAAMANRLSSLGLP